MENFELLKSAFTLIVSILSSYFVLREQINKAIQKNQEQSKEIDFLRQGLEVMNGKREALLTKIVEVSFSLEEYKTSAEKLENRLERLENERIGNKSN